MTVLNNKKMEALIKLDRTLANPLEAMTKQMKVA
jgi:hypothetical protein